MRKPPRPPYELPCSNLTIIYPADADRLRPLLPERFELDPILGQHILIVMAYSYYNAHSVHGGEFLSYNELAYATPVTWRGRSGLYYYKLHLNDPTARRAGRAYYGFPKVMADVRFHLVRDRFRVEGRTRDGDRLIARLNGQIETGMLEAVGAQAASMASHLLPVLRRGMQVHDGKVARFKWNYDQQDVFPATLRKAQLPYLSRCGLMSSGEAMKPLLSLFATRSMLWMDRPREE